MQNPIPAFMQRESAGFIGDDSVGRSYPDSKTMLGQRWQRVVRLAYGWGWKYNVGPALSLC